VTGPGARQEARTGRGQDEVRRHNLSVLLRAVHVQGPTSRARLTAATGLNRSTIGTLAAELADAGLIREETVVERRGAGRPSLVVTPERERVYVLALNIGVDRLVAARVGLGGVVLDRRQIVLGQGDYDVRTLLRRVGSLSRALLDNAPQRSVLVGIGVAVPGIVRREDGFVRLAPNLGWVDVPLGDLVGELLPPGVPLNVGNDADYGALAEHVRGSAADVQDLIYLSGEVGLGGGIIVGGKPLSGVGGYAGEVGHMVINPGGRLCHCGGRGCLETEVGEEAVLAASGQPATASLEDVVAAATAGDPEALRGLRRTGGWLGLGVTNLVNVFNPSVVIFGGRLQHLLPYVESEVHQALERGLRPSCEQVRLTLPALGADSTLLGAAELAFTAVLDDPMGSVSGLRTGS
jgi:predicted NBD/HSP70 family sugar kinase